MRLSFTLITYKAIHSIMPHVGVVGNDLITPKQETAPVQEVPQGLVKWSTDDVQ